MPSNAGLFMQLLGAFAPEKSNPYYGAKEYTPEDQLKTLNSQPENTLDPYESVEEANKDGHNITHSVWLNDKNEDVTKQVSDPKYNPRQPMVSPSWYQRFTNPSAAQDATFQNNAAIGLAAHAQQVRDAQLGVEANDFSKIRSVIGQPLSGVDDRQAAILTGGNNTSQNIGAVSESQADQGLGNPAARALNTSLSTGTANRELGSYARTLGPEDAGRARAYKDYNDLTATHRAAMVGLPVSQVNAENSTANRVVATNEADAKNILPRAQIEYEQLKASLGREPRAEELASTLLDTQLSNADIQQVVARVLQSNKNTIANTARVGVNNEAFNATHPSISSSMFYRNASGGVSKSPDYLSPETAKYISGLSMMQDANKFMNGSSSAAGATPVGNGLNIINATNATIPDRPLRTSISGGGTNAPSQQPLTIKQPLTSIRGTNGVMEAGYNPWQDIHLLELLKKMRPPI